MQTATGAPLKILGK